MPEQGSAADKDRQPRIFVAQRKLDLGTMIEGDKKNVAWTIENHGSADLVIEKTKSGCGCTVVKLSESERVIPAGGVLKLDAVFDSAQRGGPQVKKVTVHSNDPVEPKLDLEFKVQVEMLYAVNPPGIVNLQALRRGETASKTVEVIRGKGRRLLELLGVEPYAGKPILYESKPYEGSLGEGYQLQFTVPLDTALGTFSSQLKIKLRVDDEEREPILLLRGEVVGDLSWQPKIINLTRQKLTRGKRLTPLTVRSTDKIPFDVVAVSAGPFLDATVEPVRGTLARTRYKCHLRLRPDAPPGPFAATVEVRSNVLDQPVIKVPVFGIIPAPIDIDPPIILFRQDGTSVGSHRLVKLQAPTQSDLNVRSIHCDSAAVTANVDAELSAPYRHIRFLDVILSGQMDRGTHHASLTVETTVDGAEHLEIPVTIEVP